MAKPMNKYEKRRYDFLLSAKKKVEKEKLKAKDKMDLIQIKLPLSKEDFHILRKDLNNGQRDWKDFPEKLKKNYDEIFVPPYLFSKRFSF